MLVDIVLELFDRFEIKVVALERQGHLLVIEVFGLDLDLHGHLCVIKHPVLRVEGDEVLALDECDVRAHVELVLELAYQLEQLLALLEESEA